MKRLAVLTDGAIISTGDSGALHVFPLRSMPEPCTIGFLLALAESWEIDQFWLHPSFTHSIEYAAPNWNIYPMMPDEAGWYHAFRPGMHGDGIDLAIPANDDRAPWAQAATGRQMLEQIVLFNQSLRHTYAWSPGHTGTTLMKAVHGGGQSSDGRYLRIDAPGEPPAPAKINPKPPSRPFAWIRALTEQEQAYKWLHSFDKNGAYLGASGIPELGLGEWEYSDKQDGLIGLGGKMEAPGYFHVDELAGSHSIPLPSVLDPDGFYASHPDREMWVTTPALNAAVQAGFWVHWCESYMWPNHSRVLAPWAKRLSDARSALHDYPLALETLKNVYAQSLQWLDGSWHRQRPEKQDMLYRPDWRHMVVAQSTANTWRRVMQMVNASVSVVAVAVDCIYVVSDLSAEETVAHVNMSLGNGLKDYKIQDEAIPLERVVDIFDAGHLSGYAARGRALNTLRMQLGSEVEVTA